ncbi:hypothetical protein [Streptomyces sp. NPDC088785]|uniref:hypothetical protein n=1 Tax=Streptomyces sp. NPDC088785 TaxID=3365897 RepID=UPI003802ED12
MVRRVAGAVLGAAVGGVLLSGCTPAQYPMVAGWLDDRGTPMVVASPCDGDRVEDMDLSGSDPSVPLTTEGARRPRADTRTTVTAWSATAGPGRAGAFEFPLFDPPSAWHVSKVGDQRLKPAFEYYVLFKGGRSVFGSYNGIGGFSTEDLRGLEPGQVWSDGRAMTRQEFDDRVADAC